MVLSTCSSYSDVDENDLLLAPKDKNVITTVRCRALVVLGTVFAVLISEAALSLTRGLKSPWPFVGALTFDTVVSIALLCCPWHP